jgi:hypothetical protein
MVMTSIPISANAATSAKDSWSYKDDESYGTYVPRSGSLTASFYYKGNRTDSKYRIKTYVEMTLTKKNVAAIKKYNKGEGITIPKAYLTCDVTSVRKGGSKDSVHVTSVTSNLPNPKYDMESDNLDGRNEESETVVLGTVTNTSYYMTSYWNDFRGGNTNDVGKFQCQFAVSKKGIFDYNNYKTSSVIQAVVKYNKNRGVV